MTASNPDLAEEFDVSATIVSLDQAIREAQSALTQLESGVGSELAEKQHMAEELELRNCALNAVSSGIAIIDILHPDQPFVFVNQAFAAMHGSTREALVGAPCNTTPLAPSSMPKEELLRTAMATGQEVRTELQIVRADGSTFWLGLFLGPVRNARGHLTHYVANGADITARMEADRRKQELQEQLYAEMKERERISLELRLAQKLESVGRLAAGVAHEINTPIQYVGDSVYFLRTAMADMETLLQAYRRAFEALATGESSNIVAAVVKEAETQADCAFLSIEVPKAFERTLDGVDRVANIVRAMKEFAHPDQCEQSPADINHALQTTLTVARNEYKYVAEVHTEFADLPPVTCNISELNQVFLNLIVNAAHAIESAQRSAESGRIGVATEVVGDFVHVRIGDNGCGIPQEHLDRIFDPFFTTKEVGKGTGQGLAIARSIVVDKHMGDIAVDTTIDVGTAFTIKLPIAGRPLQAAAA